MIKLTSNLHAHPEIHLFNKSTILFGTDLDICDVLIPSKKAKPLHMRLSHEKMGWVLYNLSNDPFTSLNNCPFGEKILQSGDLITVDGFPVLFEAVLSTEEKKSSETDTVLADTSENPHQWPAFFDFSCIQGVDPLNDEKTSSEEIKTEMEDIENQLFLEKDNQKIGTSLKDDYLSDLDDENHSKAINDPFDQRSEPSHLFQAWKWIVLFIVCLFTAAAIVGSLLHVGVNDRSQSDEIKATQGVADIAMALVHARISGTKPNHHNWSDHDFLKTQLQSVLPSTFSYGSQLDPQGQFKCCPYSLRIYTNSDLSRFFLIAQPDPSVFYWLLPKPIIVVDSDLMEIRTLKDVRGLNRLVATPDALEGANGQEITTLTKQGALIRLAALATESGQPDFAPPKTISSLRKEAENLIYNAPRYYHLGQPLLQKAGQLTTSKTTGQNIKALKKEIETFSHLQSLVLYSDQGLEFSKKVQKELFLITPEHAFILGYLSFNDEGQVKQAALLDALNETGDSLIAYETVDHEKIEEPALPAFYDEMQRLILLRQKELSSFTVALCDLLQAEERRPLNGFDQEFQNLIVSYLEVRVAANQVFQEEACSLLNSEEGSKKESIENFLDLFELSEQFQNRT